MAIELDHTPSNTPSPQEGLLWQPVRGHAHYLALGVHDADGVALIADHKLVGEFG